MKILKRVLLLAAVLLLLALPALADNTAATLDELYVCLFENYTALNEEFSITYTGDESDLKDADGKLRSAAVFTRDMAANLPNPDGKGADIAMMNLYSGSCSFADGKLTFKVDYMLDREQLDFMDAKAEEIVRGLRARTGSDYRKIKAVYEYVSNAFVYDEDLQKYTDYEGITTGETVCQGYALLTYRLLWALDVPCRMVTGVSFEQPHGWNIVKLDGKWYFLDITWDDREGLETLVWNYFLKAPRDFPNHTLFDSFTTEAYTAAHPLAEESYDAPKISILLDNKVYSALIIRNGRTLELTAQLSHKTKSPIFWQSSDPGIVSVDQDGVVKSITPGDVVITASCPLDDTLLPAVFHVTAVDLTTCSDWADEELNSYYLRNLYPAELCSDFQTPITREEFAQLLYMIMVKLDPSGGNYHLPGFEDIGESPYWFAIVHTVARKIFDGTSPVTFSPTDPLTREQAAKLMYALMYHYELPIPEVENFTCTDEADISPWAYPYVANIVNAGVMQGGENGAFRPKDSITREEAAVMLERFYVSWLMPAFPDTLK